MEVPTYERMTPISAGGNISAGGDTPTYSGPDLFWYWGANDPIEKGNIDLFNRPIVLHPDNSWSTVRSMTVEEEGRHVLLPTIGPKGEDWDDNQAYDHYKRTGQHLGIYGSGDAAMRASDQLHNEQADFYNERAQSMRAGREQLRIESQPREVAPPIGLRPVQPIQIQPETFNASSVRPSKAAREQLELQPSRDVEETGISPMRAPPRAGYITASGRPKVSYKGVNERVLAAANATGIALGKPLEITSARDSVHSKGSQHYIGNALDIRSRNMNAAERARTVQELRNQGFSVLVEKDHIHAAMPNRSGPTMLAQAGQHKDQYWFWNSDKPKEGVELMPPLARASLPVPPGWVTEEEVDIFKKTGMPHGDKNAALALADAGLWQFKSTPHALAWMNDSVWLAKWKKMSGPQKDFMLENYVGAQRSPVSSLGFDMRHISMTEDNKPISVAGFYRAQQPGKEYDPKDPSVDRMWVDPTGVGSPVHESLHRGIEMLRASGKLGDLIKPGMEEIYVRAMMIKAFGWVELGEGKVGDKETKAGKRLLDDPDAWKTIEKVEALAQEHIAKRTPRGPR